MSNTQTAKQPKAEANGKPDDAARVAQEAQQAEAAGNARTFEFDGHTYEILDGQPSPRALTYIARWQIDDENLAVVLAIREMVGDEQWDDWCRAHASEQLMEFWLLLNNVAGGGEGN